MNDKYKEDAEKATFFGNKVSEMTRDELLSLIGYLCEAYVSPNIYKNDHSNATESFDIKQPEKITKPKYFWP